MNKAARRPGGVGGHEEEGAGGRLRGSGLGQGDPYGVYDVAANNGWVGVGVDHDTASFAAATLRRWWERMGRGTYPEARRLLVTADSGGSNSATGRLWKLELQRFADDTGLEVWVCHYPPGTSKWNVDSGRARRERVPDRGEGKATRRWRPCASGAAGSTANGTIWFVRIQKSHDEPFIYAILLRTSRCRHLQKQSLPLP